MRRLCPVWGYMGEGIPDPICIHLHNWRPTYNIKLTDGSSYLYFDSLVCLFFHISLSLSLLYLNFKATYTPTEALLRFNAI